MRIRRSLTSAALNSSDHDHTNNTNTDNLFRTPRCCSNNNNSITTKTSSIIICVLNQSPWDVTDLSSLQLDGGLFSLTGTIPVLELANGSQSFGSSVKLCVEETKQPVPSNKGLNRRENANSASLSPPEIIIRAEKSSTGGGKVAARKKPQIRATSVKKQQMEWNDSAPKSGIKQKGRAAATNPNEFYYYSGFGPHWGKKRETVTKSPVVANKVIVSPVQESRDTNEGGTKRDIEFVDYDEDDDSVENEETRRPGGRKRVKARSLKSLM